MDMKYRVVIVGGGPSGSCAAEEFAKDKNIETVLIERKASGRRPR
jgi:geranylgeranyl diphosphate/geranylgeranyl-bacteriochlorophyllide a reductase